MQGCWRRATKSTRPSPLAEGRELKWKATKDKKTTRPSPLAEGRELKSAAGRRITRLTMSPLAEGRELKYIHQLCSKCCRSRPSRRGVN